MSGLDAIRLRFQQQLQRQREELARQSAQPSVLPPIAAKAPPPLPTPQAKLQPKPQTTRPNLHAPQPQQSHQHHPDDVAVVELQDGPLPRPTIPGAEAAAAPTRAPPRQSYGRVLPSPATRYNPAAAKNRAAVLPHIPRNGGADNENAASDTRSAPLQRPPAVPASSSRSFSAANALKAVNSIAPAPKPAPTPATTASPQPVQKPPKNVASTPSIKAAKPTPPASTLKKSSISASEKALAAFEKQQAAAKQAQEANRLQREQEEQEAKQEQGKKVDAEVEDRLRRQEERRQRMKEREQAREAERQRRKEEKLRQQEEEAMTSAASAEGENGAKDEQPVARQPRQNDSVPPLQQPDRPTKPAAAREEAPSPPIPAQPPAARKSSAAIPFSTKVRKPSVDMPLPPQTRSSQPAPDAPAADDASADVNLAPCSICGRSFAENRLAKHQQVCAKSQNSKRRKFDPSKQRLEGMGSEAVAFARNAKKTEKHYEKKTKKANWRAQHENFINAIRAAKGDPNAVAPAAVVDQDLTPCQYCGRSFHEEAAARHIPICAKKSKDIARRR